MKKIYFTVIAIAITKMAMSQTVALNTNGYSIKLKKIDTLFYTEYSLSSAKKTNARKNDPYSFNSKYTFGEITKSRNSDLKNAARIEDAPLFTSNFYMYDDGALQAPTSQLFLKPLNVNEFTKKYGNLGRIEAHKRYEGFYYLYVTNPAYSTGESILSLCQQIYNNKDVLIIEPVYRRLIKSLNPYQSSQWYLNNNGSISGNSISGADMRVQNAWCYSSGSDVKVAVIDLGVDLNHPDLQGNLLTGYDATGNGSSGGCTASNYHGTACAGIIAAIDNSIGIKGIAYNAKIIPIRMGIEASGSVSTSDSWFADCVDQAVSLGADVISSSMGRIGSPSTLINTALTNATTNGRSSKGCVVLFAAGNDNSTTIDYPASNSNVIAVGASSYCDTRKRSSDNSFYLLPGVTADPEGVSCDNELWWGSNYGTGLDILAPGVAMATTDNVGSDGAVSGDYLFSFNGTSSACPAAAGVAALILAVDTNRTGAQVRNFLEQNCAKIGGYTYNFNVSGQGNGTWSTQAGYGRVDADAAVRAAAGITPMSISGDYEVCSTKTYSVANLLSGASVAWSSSNTGIATINSSGVATRVGGTANGFVTITATVTPTCGGQTILVTKNISVGSPYFSRWVDGPATIYASSGYYYQLNTDPFDKQLTSITWIVPNGWTIVSGQGTYVAQITTGTSSGDVECNVVDECGQEWDTYLHSEIGTGGPDPLRVAAPPKLTYTVSAIPNPATDKVTINIHTGEKGVKGATTGIKEIRISDKTGMQKRTYKFDGRLSSETINIRGLQPDIYIVQVYTGTEWLSCQLVVLK